jgi:ribosomal protein S6
VKRYEGLFILNTAGKEEAIKDTIDKISAEIATAGGKVETDRKHSAGYYVNFVFEGAPAIIAQLRHRFANNEEILRVLFTLAPAPKPAAAA